MAAYTDATKIAAYLGLTLNSPQQTQAGVVADAATAWVERHTEAPVIHMLAGLLGS